MIGNGPDGVDPPEALLRPEDRSLRRSQRPRRACARAAQPSCSETTSSTSGRTCSGHDRELRLVRADGLVLAGRELRSAACSPRRRTRRRGSMHPLVPLPGGTARPETLVESAEANLVLGHLPLARLHAADSTPVEIARRGVRRANGGGTRPERSWSSICPRARRRSARRARSSTGSRLSTPTGRALRRAAAGERALHERGQVRLAARGSPRSASRSPSPTRTCGWRSAIAAAASPRARRRCRTRRRVGTRARVPRRARGPLGHRPQRRDLRLVRARFLDWDARELLLEGGRVRGPRRPARQLRRRGMPSFARGRTGRPLSSTRSSATQPARAARPGSGRIVPDVHQPTTSERPVAARPLDRRADGHLARLEHAARRCPGRRRPRSASRPSALVRRASRSVARKRCGPRASVADAEAVADPHLAGAEARERQVLAERPRLGTASSSPAHHGVVLGAVDVRRPGRGRRRFSTSATRSPARPSVADVPASTGALRIPVDDGARADLISSARAASRG